MRFVLGELIHRKLFFQAIYFITYSNNTDRHNNEHDKIYTLFAIVAGVFVPLIFKVISSVISVFPPALVNIMLIIWPSSLIMLTPSSSESFFSEVVLISNEASSLDKLVPSRIKVDI